MQGIHTIMRAIFLFQGGLKAAILADVMQGLTMIFCSVVIIIQGTLNVGVSAVVNVPRDEGRLKFFDFNTDPTIRVTTLSALFGQLFMSLSIFGCQQNFVQRYCSMKSQKTVTQTLLANIPVITVLFSLSWVAGMVIFANYVNCDPLSLGYINKIDEIVPFFVEDQFTYLPGFLGLFMASLFNGALSECADSFSSSIDSAKKVKPIAYLLFQSCGLQPELLGHGCIYGLVIMGVSFGVGLLSGVIESSMLMTSATSGPLLGVFVLAMLFPCANWKNVTDPPRAHIGKDFEDNDYDEKGASSGMIIGHVITLWITFGGLTVDKAPVTMLPLSVDGCTNDSYSHIMAAASPLIYAQSPVEWSNHSLAEYPLYVYNLTQEVLQDQPEVVAAVPENPLDILSKMYSITYMYYSLIGCGITLFVGILVSYLTGTNEDDAYDVKLIHPLALRISSWFPGRQRKYVSDRITSPEKHRESSAVPETLLVHNEVKTNAKPHPCEFPSEGRYRVLQEPFTIYTTEKCLAESITSGDDTAVSWKACAAHATTLLLPLDVLRNTTPLDGLHINSVIGTCNLLEPETSYLPLPGSPSEHTMLTCLIASRFQSKQHVRVSRLCGVGCSQLGMYKVEWGTVSVSEFTICLVSGDENP
uniref:Sodium-coupled monocarboxylate transporter 2 n=1 Tax=Timema shepardi TaxID=629360 RepID=A0A7R9AZX2_TIMSH|nr:unnamed protein product [Timema shepardi]